MRSDETLESKQDRNDNASAGRVRHRDDAATRNGRLSGECQEYRGAFMMALHCRRIGYPNALEYPSLTISAISLWVADNIHTGNERQPRTFRSIVRCPVSANQRLCRVNAFGTASHFRTQSSLYLGSALKSKDSLPY